MIPTKLEVFRMQWDVNVPEFTREACENCNGGIYAICWNIFRNYIAMVAERATELNDPIMNVLMLRMGLYDVPNEKRHELIRQIEHEIKLIEQ